MYLSSVAVFTLTVTVTVARQSGAGGAEGRSRAPGHKASQAACVQVEHLDTGMWFIRNYYYYYYYSTTVVVNELFA